MLTKIQSHCVTNKYIIAWISIQMNLIQLKNNTANKSLSKNLLQ